MLKKYIALLCAAFGFTSSALCAFTPTEKTDKLIVSDQLLKQNAAIVEKYEFFFRGKTFVGYPNVYSPIIFPGAKKQSVLPLNAGDSFLELGCGSGVFAVCAALDDTSRVVAIDINPDAVANTMENAVLHGVADKMAVLLGDMFKPLAADERFDVIYFNIPFCHRECDVDEMSMLGRSLFDPGHELLYRFLKEGREHLAEGGNMLLGYSTTHGDIELMYRWAAEYGWEVTLLHKDGDEKVDFITVELYSLRTKR